VLHVVVVSEVVLGPVESLLDLLVFLELGVVLSVAALLQEDAA
jgi:hypothetical protein